MEKLRFREEVAKSYMETRFVPALHKLLKEANPKMYERWGGNCCRQTAVFGTKILEQLLPNYKWSAWVGTFRDIHEGRETTYEHAWIFGVDRTDKRRLLVDMARLVKERLFILVPSNKYPKDHPEYKDMVELSRREMDIPYNMLEEYEFYTNMRGLQVFNNLLEEIKKTGVR